MKQVKLQAINKDRKSWFCEGAASNGHFYGTELYSYGRHGNPTERVTHRNTFIVKINQETNRFNVDTGSGSGVKITFQLET